jgi:hypothetical protein
LTQLLDTQAQVTLRVDVASETQVDPGHSALGTSRLRAANRVRL